MHTPSPRSGARRRAALLTAALVAGLTLLGSSPAAAAPAATTLTLDAPTTVTVGQTLTVTVDATGLSDVFADQLTVTYDPALVSFVDATTPDGGFSAVTTATGSVTVADTRLGTSPALAGDLRLATLRFTALADGTLRLSLSAVTLVGTDTVSSTLTDVSAADVTVDPVPGGPSPSPSATPTVTPVSSTPTAGAPATTAGTTTTAAAPRGAALASTGATVGGIAVLAVGAVVVGVLLVRRRAAMTR